MNEYVQMCKFKINLIYQQINVLNKGLKEMYENFASKISIIKKVLLIKIITNTESIK